MFSKYSLIVKQTCPRSRNTKMNITPSVPSELTVYCTCIEPFGSHVHLRLRGSMKNIYIHVYRILPVTLGGPWVTLCPPPTKPRLVVLGIMDLWSPTSEK